MRYRCPCCATSMRHVKVEGKGVYYSCENHGSWVFFNILTKFKDGATLLQRLLNAPAKKDGAKAIPCPNCRRPMETKDFAEINRVEVDLCVRCQGVWFDLGEVDLTVAKLDEEAKSGAAPGFAPQKMEWPSAQVLQQPGSHHFRMSHLFGLPAEEEHVVPLKPAQMTWVLIAICVFFTLLLMTKPEKWINYAFFPEKPMLHMGVNWISSLFLHGGLIHLVGNCYFLHLCGDNIEDELGGTNLVVLFFLGGIAGHLITMLMAPGVKVTLGASGAISALLSYYAFAFPKNRILISFLRRRRYLIGSDVSKNYLSLSISPVLFLLLNVVKDSFGIFLHKTGIAWSNINHWAHLGGVAAGIIFYGLYGRSSDHG